jgi:activator of HSP90 ATPase
MTDSFEISALIPASPGEVYSSWLDSARHGEMTGTQCAIDPAVGGVFSVSDGYITGTNVLLEPGQRIVQSWRTSEFPDGSPDSLLELRVEAEAGGTRLTLIHSAIPRGQGAMYREGWDEYYFKPMVEYFSSRS